MTSARMIYSSIFRLNKHNNNIVYSLFKKGYCSTAIKQNQKQDIKFEPVFSFSFIKYIAPLHRAKVYHGVASCVAIPICGILEIFNVLSQNTFLAATYIGITGGIVLTAASLPFHNTIGFLYVSQDNKHIKISVVDFWGKRKDKIILTDDWIPLNDMAPKTLDALYLKPTLLDGTKYKLFLKFGSVLNSKKIGQVLE